MCNRVPGGSSAEANSKVALYRIIEVRSLLVFLLLSLTRLWLGGWRQKGNWKIRKCIHSSLFHTQIQYTIENRHIKHRLSQQRLVLPSDALGLDREENWKLHELERAHRLQMNNQFFLFSMLFLSLPIDFRSTHKKSVCFPLKCITSRLHVGAEKVKEGALVKNDYSWGI